MRLYRFTLVSGLAIGYVLGAQAGRERYEQMRKMVRSLADSPAVQQAAGALHAQATGTMKSTWNMAAAGARKGVSRVRGQQADPGQADVPSGTMSGNGSAPRRARDNQHPFVPVNGDFGDHDLI